VSKKHFEFRSTRNGARIIRKDMLDYQSVKVHSESYDFSYYTFYSKSERPIKALIRHKPINTLEEDIVEGLVDLSFVISVRQKPLADLGKQLNPLPCFCSL
jgi:hypothetical protein